jgi:hypothetical protein
VGVVASTVSGNVKITQSADFLIAQSSEIAGNIEIKENEAGLIWPGLLGNPDGGNVIYGNVIYGNVEIYDNFASGLFGLFFIETFANTIMGNLECEGNTPGVAGIDTNRVDGEFKCCD